MFGVVPILSAGGLTANLILIAHFTWAIWMVSGAVLAVLGFRWRRFWGWRVFRITHLIGLVLTATTPFWADGICPLTRWEWQLRSTSGQAVESGESFIIHWMSEILFIDVDPFILSLVTGVVALTTLVIFILRPPWRFHSGNERPAKPVTAP
jgi:hypothetical protein